MGYVLLLVDDSSTSRKILAKALRMAGLEIVEIYEAEDGIQAWEILRKEDIHCVFADLNMPRMGGEELVEKMAEEGLLSRIPTIVVTSDGERSRLERLMEMGVRAWLNKPFHPEELLEILGKVLGEPSGKGPLS